MIESGLIYKTNYQDYILGGNSELSNKINLRPIEKREPIEYNQKLVSKVSCTIHGAVGCISDLTRHQYTTKKLKELWDIALKNGAEESYGWDLYKAVDLVRNDWNKTYPKDRILSFRIKLNSKEFIDALSNGYSIMCGYRGNSDYNKDSQDNGILEGEDFKPSTYGHCIRIRKKFNLEPGDKTKYLYTKYVIDNYTGLLKQNQYFLKDLTSLLSNNVYYEYGYLFIKENIMTKIYEDVSDGTPFFNSIKKAKDKGIVKGFEDNTFRPNEKLTRGQFVAILDRLGLID